MQDIWQPRTAAALIESERVSFTMASTVFLTDLADALGDSGRSVPTLRVFLCACAPIPGPLVEKARAALGAKIVPAWGMTEMGAVTLTRLDDDERAFATDGRPLPGVEVRVVDACDAPLPAGTVGRLLVRSCSSFGGYLHRAHLNATDPHGWFDTGDLAYLDARLYPHQRAQQGRDHSRGREHSGGGDRGAPVSASRDRGGGARRLSRRASRRARVRGRRQQAGRVHRSAVDRRLSQSAQGRDAIHSGAPARVRQPAHDALRQGTEVQAARVAARRRIATGSTTMEARPAVEETVGRVGVIALNRQWQLKARRHHGRRVGEQVIDGRSRHPAACDIFDPISSRAGRARSRRSDRTRTTLPHSRLRGRARTACRGSRTTQDS
ncbi:Long-chain-fatty-acid CoA ligase [Candidatus Paraburkholderia kirkii]|nr:Long-chain-fatty-acid CoA ligase [Candidatus Paraburkholderia kirkii]